MDVTRTTVEVAVRWPESGPRCKPWYGSKREAEWSTATMRANLPIVPDDVWIEARGQYVKADGSVGLQHAEGSFMRLSDFPGEVRNDMWVALVKAAAGTSEVTK